MCNPNRNLNGKRIKDAKPLLSQSLFSNLKRLFLTNIHRMESRLNIVILLCTALQKFYKMINQFICNSIILKWAYANYGYSGSYIPPQPWRINNKDFNKHDFPKSWYGSYLSNIIQWSHHWKKFKAINRYFEEEVCSKEFTTSNLAFFCCWKGQLRVRIDKETTRLHYRLHINFGEPCSWPNPGWYVTKFSYKS